MHTNLTGIAPNANLPVRCRIDRYVTSLRTRTTTLSNPLHPTSKRRISKPMRTFHNHLLVLLLRHHSLRCARLERQLRTLRSNYNVLPRGLSTYSNRRVALREELVEINARQVLRVHDDSLESARPLLLLSK